MTMRWRVHEDALTEIDATVAWYDAQRPGLGLEFMAELRTTIASLRATPGASRPERSTRNSPHVRRRRLTRFPYAIVFVETETEYVIIAVMHRRRRPGYWHARVNESG